MSPQDYWKSQLMEVWRTIEADDKLPIVQWHDPQIIAALIVARQLRDIVTGLDQIRAQLNQLEDSIANQ